MTNYDYRKAVLDDVKTWIEDNGGWIPADVRYDRGAFEKWLYDTLWVADSVTGNGSGSYAFSTYDAETYLCHNLDLLAEAVEEFGGNTDVLKDGAESCDVTIRCYLLGESISRACAELEEAGFFENEDEDESEEKDDMIDFWYNNKPEEVDDITCYWSDTNLDYRGNFFIDGKVVGDFIVSNSEKLRDIVPQCFEIPFC